MLRSWCVKQLAQTVLTGHNRNGAMSSELNPHTDPDRPTVYQIRIKGRLGQHWADWFEGMAITLANSGETLLTGPVVDQAALHGLLKKVRDLGVPLLSVVSVQPGQTGVPDTKR
jgi:hypothetical protein